MSLPCLGCFALLPFDGHPFARSYELLPAHIRCSAATGLALTGHRSRRARGSKLDIVAASLLQVARVHERHLSSVSKRVADHSAGSYHRLRRSPPFWNPPRIPPSSQRHSSIPTPVTTSWNFQLAGIQPARPGIAAQLSPRRNRASTSNPAMRAL